MNNDNYAYIGADTNPSGYTNTILEARKATHYFDQQYADFAIYEEHRKPIGPTVRGNYDTPYNNSYRDIIKTKIERNPVSDMFFSHRNLKHLKYLICRSIYQQSGGVYNPSPEAQSDNELLVVMRSMYLGHARHLPDKISEQVAELNFQIMIDMVPRAISSAQQQLSFIRDSTQQPLPMDRPQHMSSAGTRSNRSVTTTFI
jgi:hypothetical protein